MAANIKKGVTVGDIVGTWEGYVANPTDLYYKGTNPAGFAEYSANAPHTGLSFESTYLKLYSNVGDANKIQILSGKAYQFAGYNNLKITFYIESWSLKSHDKTVSLYDGKGNTIIDTLTISGSTGSTVTVSFPLTSIQKNITPRLSFVLRNSIIQIQQIWLTK